MTNATQRLPYGESEHKEWPGGMAYVHVEGNFLYREGVSTCVELIHQPRRFDGALEPPRSVKTMRESGTYRIALTPGRLVLVQRVWSGWRPVVCALPARRWSVEEGFEAEGGNDRGSCRSIGGASRQDGPQRVTGGAWAFSSAFVNSWRERWANQRP